MFAVSSTTTGDFPPSSSVTPARCLDAAPITAFPIFGLPVKKIWLTGFLRSSIAGSWAPKTTATSFSGKTFSTSLLINLPEAGVNSEGLIIAVFPAATAAIKGFKTNIIG